jgi:hypothetical protein
MEHQQYEPYDQDNVNECGGDVKCKEPKQPKNDQNCGDPGKHVVVSFFPDASVPAIVSFQPGE